MKKIIFILLLALTANGLFAQEENQLSAMTKKEKRETEEDKQYQLNKYMLENKDFVLEANYIQNRFGYRQMVNSIINFVAVDSTTAIIQIGSDFRQGPNGVGGVTAKGKITRWKLTENKKHKSFNLSISVNTSIGIYDLQFTIDSTGSSTAQLTGLSAGQLTFEGDVEPYSNSRVFEGQSL